MSWTLGDEKRMNAHLRGEKSKDTLLHSCGIKLFRRRIDKSNSFIPFGGSEVVEHGFQDGTEFSVKGNNHC